MTTTDLRKAIKAVDPQARVTKINDKRWAIRTYEKRNVLQRTSALGLKHDPIYDDVENRPHGDWVNVLQVFGDDVEAHAKKKNSRQLDIDIAHALAKRTQKPKPEVVALFDYLADQAESYGRENLSDARRAEGYTGDPKEFRFSEIWARRAPDYKNSLLVDYITEASKLPHPQLGRKLTDKETDWMQREASKIHADEARAVREDLAR